MTLRFHIEPTLDRPYAAFNDEPMPRRDLLAGLIIDQGSIDEDSQMFLGELAKAEAGEPGIIVGNHGVWAIMDREKVVLEEMLYGEEQEDGTEPARTEITLQEARQLILDWLEAKKKWYAEHPKGKSGEAG